jgi:hypothetical protein
VCFRCFDLRSRSSLPFLSIGETIVLAVGLNVGRVESQGIAAAAIVVIVVVLAVLAVLTVLTILALLTVLALLILLAVLSLLTLLTILAVLALTTELGLSNTGCEQQRDEGGEAHDEAESEQRLA